MVGTVPKGMTKTTNDEDVPCGIDSDDITGDTGARYWRDPHVGSTHNYRTWYDH